MKRGQEYTDYVNASFIDVSLSLLFQVTEAGCNTNIMKINIVSNKTRDVLRKWGQFE